MAKRRVPPAVVWTIAVFAVVLGLTAVTLVYITRSSPWLRDRVVSALNERFRSRVGLAGLQVTAFPRPGVSGSGLELRHNGRTDVPPLFSIRSFSGSAGLYGLFASPLHLNDITLDGLTIQIPPGGMRLGSGQKRPDGAAPRRAAARRCGSIASKRRRPGWKSPRAIRSSRHACSISTSW